MAQVTKDRIRWDGDDWLSGIIPHYAAASILTAATLTTGKGFAFARNVDPMRSPGYIQPGCTGSNATNNSVIDGYLKNAVPNGLVAYAIGGGKLHEITISSNTVTNGATFPHTISDGHATYDGQDVALYYVGATKYLFYSYNDATDGNVGGFDLSATFDDDWMSTVPASGAVLSKDYPHPMIVGDDNILYIANGRNVASLQGQTGANGTFNPSALDLPNDYVITSFAKLPQCLVIFAYKAAAGTGTNYYRSEATAFIWDCVSDTFTSAYDLDGNYVAGGFNYNGTVGCFVQGNSPELGSTKLSRLMLFNGSEFQPKLSFRHNVPQWGSVEVISNCIYWLSGLSGGSAVIYQFGSPYEEFDNKFNYITEAGGDFAGMLRELSSGSLFVSSGTTTSGGLQKFAGTGYAANSLFTTPNINLTFPEFSQARAKTVKIYWGNVSTTHSVSVNLLTDRGNTITEIVSRLGSNVSTLTKYEEDASGNPLPRFNSIALNVSWDTTSSTNAPPIIQAVEVWFEPVNID